jgi:hypothetical protein
VGNFFSQVGNFSVLKTLLRGIFIAQCG